MLHVDKSTLTPMFGVISGIRSDSRFKDQGVLAAFDEPNLRWFYGVAIDTLQVVKQGAPGPIFHHLYELRGNGAAIL